MASSKRQVTPPGRFAATLPIEGRESAGSASVTPVSIVEGEISKKRPRHSNGTTAQAKALRRRLTGPEAKLWSHLKRIKTIDTHFRKQVPIGSYIADFVCLRGRLVIEVDGEQHGRYAGRKRDEGRDQFLRSQGFTVLRFWNHEVLQEMDAVLDTIYAELHGSTGALARSASKRASAGGEAPSSPLMGEVPSASEAEGVQIRIYTTRGGE